MRRAPSGRRRTSTYPASVSDLTCNGVPVVSAKITRPRIGSWFAELVENQLKMDTQYYYIDAQSWSAENPDAFAGAHSQIGMMVQFD